MIMIKARVTFEVPGHGVAYCEVDIDSMLLDAVPNKAEWMALH